MTSLVERNIGVLSQSDIVFAEYSKSTNLVTAMYMVLIRVNERMAFCCYIVLQKCQI